MNDATPPPVAPPAPVYVTAKWTKFPDINEYYPSRAQDDEVEGSATVECTVVGADGRVKCSVVSENPPGYGFGAATVKAVEGKGRADTSAGQIQVGSKMKLTVRFQLG